MWAVFLCMVIFFTARMWQPEPEYAIPVGVFETALITYVFALLDMLQWQPWFMLGGVTAMGAVLAFSSYKGRVKKLDAARWIKSLCVLGALIVFLTIYFYGHEILTNDDYNYYGTVVKYLWQRNSLVGLQTVCGPFSEYHPIISIWHYYVNKCFGSYQDWHQFFSYAIFLYICEMPILNKIGSGGKLSQAFGLFLFLIFPWTLSGKILYMMLGVDVAVGFLFGYTIYMVMNEAGKNWLSYSINMIICVSMLGLSKSPAVLFTVICLIGYIIELWCQEEPTQRCKWIGSIFTPAVSFAVIFSWKIYCKYSAGFGHSNYMGILKRSVTGELGLPSYAKTVVVEYIKKMLTSPINETRGMTVIICVGVFLAVILICKKNAALKKSELLVGIVMTVGFGAFVLGHLWMYLYGFTEHESLILSAWNRYMSMYMIPVVYLSLIFVRRIPAPWIGGGILVLFLFSMPWGNLIRYGGRNFDTAMAEQINHRHEMREAVRELSSHIEDGDIIGIAYGGETLYYLRGLALKYELLPNKVMVIGCDSEDTMKIWAIQEGWDKLLILTDINGDYRGGNIYQITENSGTVDFVRIN